MLPVSIRDSARALRCLNLLICLGAATIFLATLAFQNGVLGPIGWMILSGAGLYLGYTSFQAIYFDRLLAATGRTGNAGFLIYIADAPGYLGSVVVMVATSCMVLSVDWLQFVVSLNYLGAAAILLMMLLTHFAGRAQLAPISDMAMASIGTVAAPAPPPPPQPAPYPI